MALLNDAFGDQPDFTELWAFLGPEHGARIWVDQLAYDRPLLVDDDRSLQNDYLIVEDTDGAWAPYPRHFVIDRAGKLVYVGITVDPEALLSAVEDALAN